jgi:hypothetical protein
MSSILGVQCNLENKKENSKWLTLPNEKKSGVRECSFAAVLVACL